MTIYILEMGRTKYGDCILITHNKRNILIDGAHPGDSDSIRFQLSKILKKKKDIAIDLLIVSHCHSDHIGCLPDLVSLGIIKVNKALVADENIGWGTNPTDNTDGILPDAQRGLLTALQEEDVSDLPDDELEKFLFDAALLRDKYEEMLSSIAPKNLVRYGRHTATDIKKLEIEFKDFGLKILGPDKEHLTICKQALAGTDSMIGDIFTTGIGRNDSYEDLVDVYRNAVKKISLDAIGLEDRPGPGAAKNNQSIVLSVAAEGWKALLAADMQFAKPEIKLLDEKMKNLLETVNKNGPYDFIKLTHHSSYNGLNESILLDWNKNTSLFVHTGGWNDPSHPDGSVLRILEKYKESLSFARNDRNGVITVQKGKEDVEMEISKGDFNDFSINESGDKQEATPIPPENISLIQQPAVNSPLISETINSTGNLVEVTAKVPDNTLVTITIDVSSQKKKITVDKPVDNPVITDGNRFSGLLFVTSLKRLEKSINHSLTGLIENLKALPGVTIMDIPDNISCDMCAAKVREITARQKKKGVVIIGGYDIIPAEQLDVLDTELRKKLIAEGRGNHDADDFIVWSDDIYGDNDNDHLAELPVSRIPDGKSYELLAATLTAPRFVPKTRFGVRNYARPFAQSVFTDIPGGANNMEISETFGPSHVLPQTECSSVYYMLHGSSSDTTRFWGETQDKDLFEAFTIDNVPVSAPGSVVFTGCCWGALTVSPTANRTNTRTSVRQLLPDQSIALAYLKAGALAFVGCTGTHYSPGEPPYNYYGKPMHDHFWKSIANNISPAEALFNAKVAYAKDFPHGLPETFNQAVELKILRQYTCLGLGW